MQECVKVMSCKDDDLIKIINKRYMEIIYIIYIIVFTHFPH